ncbi:MAG TPA: hypothetical protein VF789_25065 [Thermoanaerobaculia bacterium]
MRRLFLIAWLGLYPAIAGAQQVTLPLEKYEDLRARASAGGEDPTPPPAPWALESADYEVKAGPESARVVQTLRFTLFDDKWQSLPLGEAGAFIRADFRGLEGRVDMAGGAWVLQARGRGVHEVVLESAVPVVRDETATRPTWRFGLRFPAAAVVRGRIAAPAAIEEVESEGPGLTLHAPEGGWTFVALPNGEIRWTLSGRATLPRRALLPLRFEATTATATTLSRTRLQAFGWIETRVAQGRLETLRVPVPAGFKVVTVRGPVAGWDAKEGALVITPLAPVEDRLAVEVELTGEPRDVFATPLLIPEGSVRTLPLAKAALRGDGELNLADPGAARVAEAGEAAKLPASLRERDGKLFAVADVRRPPRWEAVWARSTEVLAAQIDRLLVNVAVGESGRASYQLWAEVRNRGAQRLSLTLPAGFTLAAGHRDGAAVTPGTDGKTLSVPLLTQQAPQVVHLDGVVPLTLPREGSFEIPMPALSVPAAKVEVRVLLPGGRAYSLAEPARAGVVGALPRTAARGPVSELSRQVNTQLMNVNAVAAASQASGFYPHPPGFIFLDAAWSALSATPSPLAIRVEAAKEKSQWF